MKVGETITFTREVSASTGYGVYPVKLENLALVDIVTDPPSAPFSGAPVQRHFTFAAIKEGAAAVQFAKFRPWELPKALYEEVLPINVEPVDTELAAANLKVGAFTPFAPLDDDAKAVFKKAFAHLRGVDYEPLLAATQVVAGLNYIFAANAMIVYPGAVSYPVLVRVYKSPSGDAKIVKFTSLGNPHRLGSFTDFAPIKPEQQAILDAALKGFAGSGFTADYVSTQLVSGMNYRFVGTQTLATKDPDKYPVLFTVYQPLSGPPVLTSVQKAYDLV
ncbi:MAG: protease inhibitor I42 family protein [Spirochaetaceae bacterium]|jgi:hypothetical protein|nr:protease inhibitor I42 family protein [Spirochaetaceae bacterium]